MPFSIQFDYRFDADGFFDDPDRRAILELAADEWARHINDEFSDIPIGTQLSVVNPNDPAQTTMIILENSIDDILIFVGSNDQGGYVTQPDGSLRAQIGEAYSLYNSGDGDAMRLRVASDFRGQGPTMDYEPFVGSIAFNDNSEINWSFDADSAVAGFSDLYSTAVHEIGHILGLVGSPTYSSLVSGAAFVGPNALAVNDGSPIPLEADGHIQDGFAGDSVVMDPLELIGVRKTPGAIDLALLADIGYEVDGYLKQGTPFALTTVGNDIPVFGSQAGDLIDGLAGNDQLQGDGGNDELFGSEGLDTLFGGSGADTLDGGQDNDQLQGNAGDDFLLGGAGDDTLFGGGDYDTYVFEGDWGTDFIVDADPSGQFIFSGYDETDLEITESSGNLLINADSNQVIFIDYVSNGANYDFNYSNSSDIVREGRDTTAALNPGLWQSGTIQDEPIAGDGVISDLQGGFVDKDWYRVTLEAGRVYSFEAESQSLTTGMVFIRLYDSSGIPVDRTTDGEGVAPNFLYDTGGQAGSEIYYLAVSAGDTNNSEFRTATGDFRIRFIDTGTGVSDTVREGTDTTASLSVGGTMSGAIDQIGLDGNNQTIDKDWYSVNLVAGRTYTFGGTAAVSSSDTLDAIAISLYSDNSTLVRDFVEGGSPSFEYSVPDGGSGGYYLAVSAGGSGAWQDKTGDYRVSLEDDGETPDEVEPQPSYEVSGLTWVDEGAGNAIFMVTRNGVFEAETIYARPISGVQNGLDQNNQDFTSPFQAVPLNFGFGQTSVTVEVGLIDDAFPENAEEFALVVQRTADTSSDILAIRNWTIRDDDQTVPSSGTDLSRPFIVELANLALAAYKESDEQDPTLLAEDAGWTPVSIPGTNSAISETSTSGLLQSNVHFYEANVDGIRTLAMAFSGTQPGNSLLSFTDFITQIGNWDDLYLAHKSAIVSVLDWAENEQTENALPFDRLVVTGHSMGGILAEEMLADPDISTTRLGAEATGVTFGSPGSPERAQTDRIVNFVTLGDPIPMLHSEDFFGIKPEEEDQAEFAISLIAAPLNFLDGIPTTVPDGGGSTALQAAATIAENIVAMPTRDGVSITMLRTADSFPGVGISPYYPLHPEHPLQDLAIGAVVGYGSYHLLEGETGYINSINQLAGHYGSASRGGHEDLEFWLNNGSGWHFLREPDFLDMSVAFAQGLGFGALNLALDGVRLVVGLLNTGVDVLQTIGNATITALEIGIDGVARAWGSVKDFFSGTADSLNTTLEGAGERVEIFFEQLGFGEDASDFSAGSAIISIDTDGDGTPDLETVLEGEFDLDRFFVASSENGTRILYAQDVQIVSSDLADFLVGDDVAQNVWGGAGNDTIFGLGGNDFLFGDEGNDALRGGLGADVLTTGSGLDTIRGTIDELDDDRVTDFALGDTIILSGSGLDPTQIAVTSGSAVLSFDTDGDGTPEGTLTLEGDFSGEAFEVSSSGGNTIIRLAGPEASQLSAAGERFITEDTGPNRVYGDGGDDVMATNAGDDLVSAGAGADVVLAGAGDDTIIGGLGPDNLTGGAGSDLFAFSADDFATGGFTADFITDFTPGEDVIELAGFGVTDLASLSFVTVAQGDAIDLGSGRFIVLEGLTSADLQAGDVVGADFARSYGLISTTQIHRLTDADDRFISTGTGPSEIIGRAGADAIVGGSGNDTIRGEGGADVLIGGAGNDRLIGGEGADQLTGRAGEDVFEFAFGEETSFVAEFITDYEIGIDTLELAGFGYSSPTDLAFTTAGSGDVAIQIEATRFVVFEGYANQIDIETDAVNWSFV